MNRMIQLEHTPSRAKLHGWILYAAGDSGRSPYYISLYQKACCRYGMSITLGVYDPSVLFGDAKEAARQLRELLNQEMPAYIVNRTRDSRLAELLESMGIRVWNNSKIARLGNDKSAAYCYMQRLGVPILPTVYEMRSSPPWYPAVVKSCGGHGGTEVFYLPDASAWEDWKKTRRQAADGRFFANQRYVIQQAASDLGKDVRVYVVGNEIKAAVLRTSRTDFRSNYCLGGEVRLYRLSDQERALVERTIQGLSIGMAGVDFIFHHGQMVFNEIEDMVGARSLYTLTDYDIVDDYMHYISNSEFR